MKLRYKIFIALSLWSVSSAARSSDAALVIASHAATACPTWSLYSKDGFIVSDPSHATVTKKTPATDITITFNESGIVINGATTKRTKLRIAPISGSTVVDKEVYEGDLEIVVTDADIMLIACDMEPEPEHAEQGASNASVKPHAVRVLLDEKSCSEKPRWYLKTQEGCTYINPADRGNSWLSDEPTIEIVVHGKVIYINGKRYHGSQLVLVPHDGLIHFNNNCYQGSFLITCHSGTAYIINALDLEDYVFSVLRTESWPGWPLEVNKVFAIACRSYAIAMIVRSKANKLPYHIKNTNAHQTYTGIHESPVLKTAVEETKGVFLAYKGKPIIAMFDGCCGGVTPSLIKDFNFSQAPYLARSYPCTYCKKCKIYNWQAIYSVHTLADVLHKGPPTIKKIKDIKVTSKDKAGLVREVALKGSKGGSVRVPGKKIYSKLKDVKSFCFLVEKQGDDVIFTGRGYGHHLGLCQWGAREMVRQGNDHRTVLQFYYPGTNFVRFTT
ncbi:MAG: SpoIID/LytB domain-containing protein [Candidatus Babeliales bacterium]